MKAKTIDATRKIGETITLMGWVRGRRDHGKLIFIDLADRWGIVQIVFTPDNNELLTQAGQLRLEWVIMLTGVIQQRPEKMINPDIATGSIEIRATGLEILNESKTPDVPLDVISRVPRKVAERLHPTE